MRSFALATIFGGAALAVLAATPASAGLLGAAAYADSVVSYDPVVSPNGQPEERFRHAGNALGPRDYNLDDSCRFSCTFASLGAGGSLTLAFTDNKLSASGDSAFDLKVFEIGRDVEATFVEISQDGLTWLSLGMIGGSITAIDIDALGFEVGDLFGFVRLTDDPNQGDTEGNTVGADIDAVAALSTVLTPALAGQVLAPVTPVPEPATLALIGMGLTCLGVWLRRSRRPAAA